MAVYTKVSKQDIAAHLNKYSLGELVDLKEIVQGIDNSNFILQTTKGKFIFTIFEARIDKNDLPFFINFKAHLAKKGVNCPTPIANNNGELLVDFNGKKSLIVTFLSGSMLEPQENGYYNNITKEHCFSLGKTLAQMHQNIADFNHGRNLDNIVQDFTLVVQKISHLLEDYEPKISDEINDGLKILEKNWDISLPSGPIHADLFPDNVFFNEQKEVSGVIDFYFSQNDLFIYDFAILTTAWCFDENNNFITEKFNAMLDGYQTLREFSKAEKSFLKTALIAAAMRFLLSRLHDMFFTPKDSLVKIKDPQEYLAKLRFFKNNSILEKE